MIMMHSYWQCFYEHCYTSNCSKQFDLQLTISFVTTQDGSDNGENSNLQLPKFCECVSFHRFLLLANSQYLLTECEK